MYSRLGAFILRSYPGQLEALTAAKPAIVKVVNSTGDAKVLHDNLGEQTIFIARTTIQGDDFRRAYNHLGETDPVGAAYRWWQDIKGQVVQAPFAYWESYNEMADWSVIHQYGLFEAERQRIMFNEGFKACVGNFATGTPDVSESASDTKRQDYWPALYPMLEACDRYQNLLGLHEYASLWLSLYYGSQNQHDQIIARRSATFPEEHEEGWLFGRYRKVWRRHIEPNNWTNIRIALTEFGLDRAGVYTTDQLTGGANAGPWKQSGQWWKQLDGREDSENYYIEQLQWADRQMQQDPYLVGATIFCWGTDDPVWSSWDVRGNVGDRLLTEMRTHPVPLNMWIVSPRQGLYLRNRPAGEVIATLPVNDQVYLYSEKDGWAKVRTSRGLTGYVMAKWLQNH
jgi:hypothetical protein